MNPRGWEQSLLGTVLAEPKLYAEVSILQPDDFHEPQHMDIWKVITDLSVKKTLSVRTLTESLRALGKLDELGFEDIKGENYILQILSMADPGSIEEFLFQVSDASTKRKLVVAGSKLMRSASNGRVSDDIIQGHMKDLINIDKKSDNIPKHVKHLLPEFQQKMDAMISGSDIFWIPPLLALKNLIGYLDSSDFVILTAEPGSGKTSLMRYFAYQTAKRGEPVAIITLENSTRETISWITSEESKIPNHKINYPKKLTEEEKEIITRAQERIAAMPLYIEQMSFATFGEVAAAVRRFCLRYEPKLIIVDGIYLIQSTNNDSKYENITETTQGFRSLAQEVNVPIIATTQMSRDGRRRPEPSINDLLYAGENPARQIWTIKKTEMSAWDASRFEENKDEDGRVRLTENMRVSVLKIHVLKNTNGPTGVTEDFAWNKPINTFFDLQKDWRGPTITQVANERLEKRPRQAVLHNTFNPKPKPVKEK